ncbi:hypothetical protein FN846DRAFT_784355 [Sphaerosporella brunnea]|uniref:Adenylyltransferase and sulfurtransferase uba4 n=1 Tax=Sphaerosporella brunnea TaxID=1250544 RepID=A0A5J5EKF6_9PEZI|nr:hypothetical protein FN846DRAFT_784355 [Sphaerosporella brunnea]
MSGPDRIPPHLADETASLRARIAELEAELTYHRAAASPPPSTLDLTREEYLRYSRQLLLPQIGLPGQTALKRSRVLIVGIGGLGSPAALYLAGAGIGTLGLIDHDVVETSNLHRQVLHRTSTIGLPKVLSAAKALRDLNPHVQITTYAEAFTPGNAEDVIAQWDVVLDCTDHPKLRYLISDACVLLGKPLVSASALKLEGQLIVLNDPPGKGPCYRCIWPRPPPPESIISCGEGGVLGPVVGAMGVMQALETIKLITRPKGKELTQPRMLFFSAAAETMWRTLKMRGRREGCVACGQQGIKNLGSEEEYALFCGVPNAFALEEEYRLSVRQARELVLLGTKPLLVDVRDRTQFGICKVPGSVNVPFERFLAVGEGLPEEIVGLLQEERRDVVVLCRLGNDSQVAAKRLLESGVHGRVWDVRGGIREWARIAPEDGIVEY